MDNFTNNLTKNATEGRETDPDIYIREITRLIKNANEEQLRTIFIFVYKFLM